MGFSSLSGNTQLKENLQKSLQKGNISHFYLISGPQGSGKHTLARLLAAAILCRENDRPCMHCPSCRRVTEGNHPDFITVDDPEKKTVPVDLIRQARSDMYVRPNESEHKIYLFPRAQDMGIPGQNALLKVLEEPPAYGVFLLLTDNPDKLLPTVRSRCTALKMLPLTQDVIVSQLRADFPDKSREDLAAAAVRSGGYLGQARVLLSQETAHPQTEQLVKSFCARDALGLVQVFAPMEKWKRDALIEILTEWIELFEGALAERLGGVGVQSLSRTLASSRGSTELMQAICDFKKALDYAQGNVSPAAICGWLSWALR